MLQIICRSTSAPIDNLAYFLLLRLALSVYYSDACVTLNPVESMPANMCLVPVSRMNEEIILANIVPFILAASFCNVV